MQKDKTAASGMCQHGNFPSSCLACAWLRQGDVADPTAAEKRAKRPDAEPFSSEDEKTLGRGIMPDGPRSEDRPGSPVTAPDIGTLDRAVGFERNGDAAAVQRRALVREMDEGKRANDHEREIGPEDIRILNLANKEVQELFRKHGRDSASLFPLERIHLVSGGMWEGQGGYFDPVEQRLVVLKKDGENEKSVAAKVFHELLHAKSYNAVQLLTGKEEPTVQKYRTGLEVISRDGTKQFFRWLNEAVVQTLTRRFVASAIESGNLKPDERVQALNRAASLKEMQYDEFEMTYLAERVRLRGLCKRISHMNREKYPSYADVEEVFIRASITGKLLEAARLVESTFGKGSFRRLGEPESPFRDFWFFADAEPDEEY